MLPNSYGPMIRYSDHPADLSNLGIYGFQQRLVAGAARLYDLLVPGGHLVVLIGLLRTRGRIHRFHQDLIAWREPTEPELVKVQHACTSDQTDYGAARFIPIVHEYVLIWRKPSANGGGR
jgi:hypothetical protein